MTRKRHIVSGWLAMTSAVLAIPWFFLTFFLAEKEGGAAKAAEASMLVAGTVLTVYLLVALQRLLNERYGFCEADRTIGLLIKANVVSAAVSLLGLAVPALASGIGIFGIIMVVVVGVLQVVFGIRLLLLPDTLQGLHKPFCFLNVTTGVCLALVVGIPLGMLTGAIADVMLGTIFFQTAPPSEQ